MTKVCFAMNFCERDAALAQKSATALGAVYPSAAVLLINDSDTKLKLPPNAGLWTEHWMTSALVTGADIVVKLDPDTRALNVATFPTTDVFGQTAADGAYSKNSTGIICGACIGFQKAAVEKIVASGLLKDTKYNAKPYVVTERRYGTRFPVILNDPIVADVIKQLNLTTGSWAGLHLQMSWEPATKIPTGTTFAHPVKE